MARRPFLMGKWEKKTWNALNENEQKSWWRLFVFQCVGMVLFALSGTWLIVFTPASDLSADGLGVLMCLSFWILFFTQSRLTRMLAERILSRQFYQVGDDEKYKKGQ